MGGFAMKYIANPDICAKFIAELKYKRIQNVVHTKPSHKNRSKTASGIYFPEGQV